MDTRSKILTLREAAALPGTILIVTGSFDILRTGHVRELSALRLHTPDAKLLAVVLPSPRAPLDQRARAEMVAALRMVDYVMAADHDDVESLIRLLKPAEVVRLEAAHARLAAQLIEHVHRRQNR